MVSNANQTTPDSPVNQGVHADTSEPNKIGASTPYDFAARNLTAYGGLLPVATMLEKLGFQQLVEETLTVKRQTRSMPMYGFILGMVLACYVGFSRLNHLRFLKREPMLTGILRVVQLPPQCTFWRFLASLHLGIARQRRRSSGACANVSGQRPTCISTRSRWTPTPRCTRCSATRWAGAKATTRRTRGRRAISPS